MAHQGEDRQSIFCRESVQKVSDRAISYFDREPMDSKRSNARDTVISRTALDLGAI